MFLYFFDLDDTICNTAKIVDEIISRKGLIEDNFSSKDDFYLLIEEEIIKSNMYDKIELLENSTLKFLRKIFNSHRDEIFYITARPSRLRKPSKQWLINNDLWLGEEKLIMDTAGIKGQEINKILQHNPGKTAILFDDLMDNHKEASKYKRILSCIP